MRSAKASQVSLPARPKDVMVPNFRNASFRSNPPHAVLGAKKVAYPIETSALIKLSAQVQSYPEMGTHAALKLHAVAKGAPMKPSRIHLGPHTSM